MTRETCAHSPCQGRTLPGRFVEHLWKGETPGAKYTQPLHGEAPVPGSVQVRCAHCCTEITHPAALHATGLKLACVLTSMVTGVLAWLLATVMMKSGSDAIVAALFTLAACAVLPLALERLLVSAVLAVCPWREINGTPEEVALRREAAYAERAELRRERRKRRVVDAIFICTVLLQGAKGGALVATVGVLMLAISLGRKQKPAVLALYAAVAAAGLLGYLQVMSTVASMALNVLAATTANAAILHTEE